MRSLIILSLAGFLVGCKPGGLPSKTEIIAEFIRENPTAMVIDAVAGEGDFEHAYWKLRYRLPGNDAIHETEWGARSNDDTDWEIFHRGADQKATP